ncbi:MAG: hypothetical protein MUP45_00105 [Candidatus Marinimicrobia bacterium]|nr:hypothetical protein [Candidatus Neomarinimicrobiota bacterium]
MNVDKKVIQLRKKYTALYKKYRGQFFKWYQKKVAKLEKRRNFLQKQLKAWKKKGKKSIKSAQKKLNLGLQYADYYWASFVFHTPKFIKFHSNSLMAKYGFILFSLLYFISLMVGVVFLNSKVNLSIDRGTATGLLFAAGAMVGGALAIVASFALFTIQNASESLPKGFYEIATNNKKYALIFFNVGLISLILFGAGAGYGLAGYGLSEEVIQGTLFLIGLSFYLLYFLLRTIRTDVNHELILLKATKQALNAVNQIYSRTAELSKVLIKHPRNRNTVTQEQVFASIFQSVAVQNALKGVNFRLTYLFDYHDALVSTQQKSSARDVLDHIRTILIKYLLSRKDNSLVLPEPIALLAFTSDSKYFLQPNLERLMSVGEEYMRKEDTYGIMYVVNLFIALTNTASEITYLGMRRSENPILEQIRGYFDMLMQRAINLKSFEGIFQGVHYYQVVAEIAVDKHLHLEFNSLHRELWKLTTSAIVNRHEPALGEVFNVYTFLINKLITSKYFNFRYELPDLLRHLKDITYYSYLFVVLRGTLRDNLLTQTDISKPYNKLRDLSFWVVQQASNAQDEDEKSEWQHIFITIVDEFRQSIRDIAQEIKNADHILILSFGQIICDIGKLLIELSRDRQWSVHRRELETQVASYLHLPHWFMYEVEKVEGNQSYDSLVEAVAQMGLLALQKDMVETAQEAIRIVFQFSNDMLTKEKSEHHYGFTEPRTAEYACYIGILALKLDKQEVIQELKTLIRTFNRAYSQEHFSNVPENIDIQTLSPSPDQLKKEVQGLVSDRERWRFERLRLGGAKDMLFDLVEAQDIEVFISLIWPEE